MTKLMILYRNKLRMSVGKIAAQAAHAAVEANASPETPVIVLGVTETKFHSLLPGAMTVIKDAGYTEVPENTITCLAYYAPLSDRQVRKRWLRQCTLAMQQGL